MENNFIAILPMNNFGGLGILSMAHNPETTVTTAFDFGNGMENISTAKVRHNAQGEQYFIKFGRRYYLKDFMGV